MECPFCDSILVQEISFSDSDLQLINSLPYVIAYPLRRTLLEQHPWTKINLLKDTFLNFLKYLSLITASEFFNSNLKDKQMVSLFQQALAEPSFGTWNQFIREAQFFLIAQNHSFFCEDLVRYYEKVETGKKRKLYKGEIQIIDASGDLHIKKQEATAIGMLINFRNRFLGHGLTLDEGDSKKLWEEYYPIFKELLLEMKFVEHYPMFKHEHVESFLLKSAEIVNVEKGHQDAARVWIESPTGESMDILPFFVVPGEVSLAKEDKEQLFTYESYTGKTIKFFSPEGTEKQTSGKILEKLNLLLREKQKEQPFLPSDFTKEQFLIRVQAENIILVDTLIAEKKVIPGVYVHREEMEIKLREWIGARANIFFIAAEAGSGKTNLLVEIQKQYAERDLHSLLIRAGRMEKQSLKNQIAYLLNIDISSGIENYSSIAGTQDHPTFILIDGINEANNAEELWQEIIALSELFEPGSLKFIITNRANNKADLSRYQITQDQSKLLYGENKDNESGLEAYAFWLTALDMNEMKSAWENYIAKDKSRFKPLFSFDDIATFDRSIYNQINNPLILRLFLEIYNGKQLPKKGAKHLHVWQDWLNTFSEEEQRFLKLLAKEIWEKGENELLLDDLLKHEILKSYFTSDIINSPYNRLKNNGWISRYVKDLNGYVGFTVEGALLYLLGLQLNSQSPAIDIATLHALILNANKFKKSAIESFLCEKALNGDLNLVSELIDSDNEDIDLCINPLLLYLKTFGVKQTIEKVLENSSENDWKVLNELDVQLEELQLHVLRKEFLSALMPHNEFKTKNTLEIGLRAITVFDSEVAINYFSIIDTNAFFFIHDSELLSQLGDCERKFGNYDKALGYYEKCLVIELKTLSGEHIDLTTSYDNIGYIWESKENYDKALEYYEKCLVIRLKTLGGEHPSVASSYNNIGSIWDSKGNFDKALEYYDKCLAIDLKSSGEEHPDVATSYNNIGLVWKNKGNYDKALDYYEKSLAIRLKTLGGEHPSVAKSYNNIGLIWKRKGNNDKALDYLKKCLAIDLKSSGEEHPDVATSYNNIGSICKSKGNYDKALEYFEKCLAIELKTLGGEQPSVARSYTNIGSIWETKGNNDKALEYYEKSIAIELKSLGKQHPSVAISYDNIGGIWKNNGKNDKALDCFKKCLAIELKNLGGEHPSVATSYYNLGLCYFELKDYLLAIESFKKGFVNLNKGGFPFNIAKCYEALDDKELALDYFIQSAEIRMTDPDAGPEDESTMESIQNAKRVAKELGKEDLLPKWM